METTFHPAAYHNIRTIDAMSAKALNANSQKRSYVNIRYRLRGKRKVYRYLNQLAGANRYLWNAALSQCEKDYEETGKADMSYLSLCKWYKNHKHSEAPWLKEYPKALTRQGLKDMFDAYKQFFKGVRRFPNFKKEGRAKKTFSVEISPGMIKNGYIRLKRRLHAKILNPDRLGRYSNLVPKAGRIFEEGGNWYITVTYEVDAVEH